jgi:hypothetical protein
LSTRLLDFETQESYYKLILSRYRHYCAGLNGNNHLNKAFAAMAIGPAYVGTAVSLPAASSEASSKRAARSAQDLSTIMMAMRKLREAIVASARTDAFARDAYLHMIRTAIVTKHMESYHPAILHLIRKIHPTSALSRLEYHEFVGYYILDLACRQNDLAQAYDVRIRAGYKDVHVDMILRAVVHDNWHLFWNAHRSATEYQKRLMEWHGDSMRKYVLKCIGRSYLEVEKSFIETAAASSWEHLQKGENLGWELNGELVTIRRIKKK